jgi:TonB family protein
MVELTLQRVVPCLGGIVYSLKTFRTFIHSVLIFAVVSGSCATICVRPANAEEPSDRKVKYRVEPQYPELARKLGLSGLVRIDLVVAANGNVKDTKVIGGHPILVNAAVDAVKKWKFESASSESIKAVEFKFQPN